MISDYQLIKFWNDKNYLSMTTDVVEENLKWVVSSRFKCSGSSNFDSSSLFKIFKTIHIDLNPVFFFFQQLFSSSVERLYQFYFELLRFYFVHLIYLLGHRTACFFMTQNSIKLMHWNSILWTLNYISD